MGNRYAKKSLGQNFLSDPGVINKIVAAFNVTEEDFVLEIGPGRGALTEKLVKRARRLYALEFDNHLAALLGEKFADTPSFVLIEGDALFFDYRLLETDDRKLRLIANLPYNISTAILQRLFDFPEVFSDCLLMFQREVVDRITAEPGTKDRGFLTVLTEAHFSVERLFDVPPAAFRPAPKVWSSVVRLIPRNTHVVNEPRLRELVSIGFGQKRKTILNNLKTKYADARGMLESTGIDAARRAETLTLDEWITLAGDG